MNQNRKLAQLMFKDNFMFGAVMVNEEICQDFLELAVGFPIERVEISKEKSMIYHPEYHGIRLDIIARDEKRTHYNVEMQVAKRPHLGKRARYLSVISTHLAVKNTAIPFKISARKQAGR